MENARVASRTTVGVVLAADSDASARSRRAIAMSRLVHLPAPSYIRSFAMGRRAVCRIIQAVRGVELAFVPQPEIDEVCSSSRPWSWPDGTRCEIHQGL